VPGRRDASSAVPAQPGRDAARARAWLRCVAAKPWPPRLPLCQTRVPAGRSRGAMLSGFKVSALKSEQERPAPHPSPGEPPTRCLQPLATPSTRRDRQPRGPTHTPACPLPVPSPAGTGSRRCPSDGPPGPGGQGLAGGQLSGSCGSSAG